MNSGLSYTVTVLHEGRAVERVTTQGRQERDRVMEALRRRHPKGRIEAQGVGTPDRTGGAGASWSRPG
ncbi:MAG TPA: hypothetical protein VEB20_06150 [Azospirillaceae bacterium]|nr:hypothetical protein [Azospirillaceae bacterium]